MNKSIELLHLLRMLWFCIRSSGFSLTSVCGLFGVSILEIVQKFTHKTLIERREAKKHVLLNAFTQNKTRYYTPWNQQSKRNKRKKSIIKSGITKSLLPSNVPIVSLSHFMSCSPFSSEYLFQLKINREKNWEKESKREKYSTYKSMLSLLIFQLIQFDVWMRAVVRVHIVRMVFFPLRFLIIFLYSWEIFFFLFIFCT